MSTTIVSVNLKYTTLNEGFSIQMMNYHPRKNAPLVKMKKRAFELVDQFNQTRYGLFDSSEYYMVINKI